ncbi:hypothetical protein HYX18_04745 [Candidatus Woesearchaeota archaeon]|nr:hypothetical protein [Candidatus Woesearchaeota archaeon]
MVQFLVGPEWFYGVDTIFEVFSIIVCFLIAIFAYKTYNLTNQRKYFYFMLSFLLIAASLTFKIIANFVVFYKTVEKSFYGLFIVTYTHSFDFINTVALFLFRFLFLIAFIIILANILNIKDKKIISLLLFFSFLAVIFSTFAYFEFHLTLALIVGFISHYYFKNYSIKKRKSAFLVMMSFMAIFLSQIMFILFILDKGFYALAETLQLIGFLFLLLAYLVILKK